MADPTLSGPSAGEPERAETNASLRSPLGGPFSGMFRALRHANFRNFLIGQGISVIGTWMQTTAMGWLVWRLTSSEEALGFFYFIGRIPALLVTPIAGVLADRYSRFRLVMWAQILQLAQAMVLAVMTLSGHEPLWALAVLAVLLGVFSAIDVPARQSFMIELVGRDDLANAIPLNSGVFNLARVIGPALAGGLVALIAKLTSIHPEGFCFLLNGVSYVAIIWQLVRMRLPRRVPEPRKGSVGDDLRQAFAFVRRHEAVRSILLYMAIVSAFGYAHSVVLPAVAKKVLGHDVGGFGVLLSASGLGAIFGAAFLARRIDIGGLGFGRVIAASGLMVGLGLILFSFSKTFWLSVALLVPAGAGMMVQSAASNTLLQQVTPDHLRGRVISFFSVVFLGLFPIGGLFMGWAAGQFGPLLAIRAGGIVCTVGGIVLLSRVSRIRTSIAELTEACAPSLQLGKSAPPSERPKQTP